MSFATTSALQNAIDAFLDGDMGPSLGSIGASSMPGDEDLESLIPSTTGADTLIAVMFASERSTPKLLGLSFNA